ncbi:uncharacterized protein LOC142176278 [Nicotiana tabacum]|uniref:Uncharacterized protein LOC142176278 n=1 Tax=Nicotiana tabacum TaxID=4097 RepID=A0AC58TQN3_TOBAC
MIGNKDLLHHETQTENVDQVQLPTGDSAKITNIGDCQLSGGDIIKNVLCVPAFKFNLLFVSKVTKDLNRFASFFPTFCVFQDLLSRRVKEIVDDYTRWTWNFLLRLKSDVVFILKNFLAMVKTQFGKSVKMFRSDNGSEFFNTRFPELSVPPIEGARKSSRTSRPPIWLKDYVRVDKAIQSNSCRYPIATVIGYNQLSPKYQRYLSQISLEQEPNSYYEAAKGKSWIESMQANIKALEDNKTWEIVPLPPGKEL